MNASWLLAAGNDLGSWIRIIIPLIVAVIYAINQIFNRERKDAQTKPARPAPRRIPTPPTVKRGPVQPPTGRPGDPQKADPLLAEIQKFLRQASGDKAAQARAQSAAGKPQRPKPIEVPPADPANRPLDTLQGRHLDTADVTAGAAHLTDDLKCADIAREQHFEQTFSHKIGSLADTSTAGPKDAAPGEAAVVQADDSSALGDWMKLQVAPENLRRVFMLNEILQRPEHRW